MTYKIWIRRLLQVFQFGWKDAREIAKNTDRTSSIIVFADIIRCFLHYYTTGLQYKKNRLWEKEKEEKRTILLNLSEENRFKDEWLVRYYKNWKFLNKYSGIKWETSQRKRTLRNEAYSKFYGFGQSCWTQYNAIFLFEHYSIGALKVGSHCLFARDCDIDITGDLEIGDRVGILEGVKILTHAHDPYHFVKDEKIIPYSNRAYKTNLKIGNNVTICAHAVILPGVKEIGDNTIIQAGAIVNKRVPANSVVSGNPAKVVTNNI